MEPIYYKKYILRGICEKYGYKDYVCFHVGSAFVLGCNAYETRYSNVYITDYDFENDDDLEKSDLSMLFYRGENGIITQKLSNSTLKDELIFNSILDNFKQNLKTNEIHKGTAC